MISPTTPMKAASPDQADRRNGWFGYAWNLTGLLMVALVAGHGTGLAEPPTPTQLPTGEQVVGGAATISRQQATMIINQSTSRAAIDWQNFDIGSQAHVNIRQPSTDSVLFNRILGNNPSQIFGGLTANGQVYLSNPSGFYFAPSASVNVGGLVATTHQLSLDEFMAGRDRFSRNGSTGRILNEGHLKAALGGYIALLAPEVRNHGVIMAELGTVALAAGEAYELRFDPARRLEGLRVEPAQIQTLVENKQAVLAPGGLIVLSAQGASQLQGSVVRHDGTLEASSLVSKGGRIMLEGDAIILGAHSTTKAAGATGGGEVLVGGGWQGSGPLKHATSTTVATGASIDVSATQRGDGGTAVLWSDVRNPISRTQVSGSILASGGAQSGNGGRIETSGHTLQVEDSTRISTLAPHGRMGEWLLDPEDFTIAIGSGAQTTSSIGAATLGTALNSGNVTIATDASTGGNGDITVAANVTKTASSGTTTLTLKSHRSVVMNNGISINGAAGAPLNVVFWADSDNSGGGGVQLRNVTTQGGHLYLGGGTASTTWNGLTVPNGPTKSFGGLAPTHFTGTLSTAGGDMYLWNGTGAGAAGQFTTAGGSGVDVFNAGVGNITLRVDAVNILNNLTITTTGLFSLLPSTSGGSFRDPVLTSKYILTGAQGGLTIGTSGNTADITHQTNAYSTNGPIQLHGGTVTLNAGLTTTNASTGDVSITASTGLTGSGGITLANGRTLTVTQSGNSTYNGVISGSDAGVTKLGIGDLSLGGASTYTGATTVNAGVLSLAAADRIPDASRLVVGANGTFSLNGFNETVGSIAGNGLIVNGAVVRDGLVLWLDAGNTSSYNGTGNTWYDLSGNGYHGTIYGSPTHSSANSLFTFANNSQYVRLSTLPANFLGSTVTGMTIFSVANFGATADNWERVVDLGNAGAGGNAPNHNIILSRYGTGSRLNFESYNGVTGGTENKTGTNSAITNGKSSYAGTADGSNLKIYKDGALNTTTASTALPGAAARADNYIGKSNWTADDTFRGDIGTLMVYNRALSATEIAKNHQLLFNRSTATLTAGGDNTNTTFSGTIENGVGTLNMVKQGTGTLTLTGANTYAGATTVQAGVLRNGAVDVVPNFSAVTVASGATWDLNSYNNTVGSVAGAGSIPLGSGTLSTGGTNASTSFSGVLSGSGGVTKTGSGTWTLSGANSYSGATTVSGGTLASGAAGSLPDASAVTLNSGTTLNLNSFTETVGSLSGTGNITLGSAALTSGGDGTDTTYSGVISGTGSLIKSGTGTWTLTGTNTYSGATTVAGGTLAVGNGGSTGTLGSGVVTSNAALVLNRSGNVALSTLASNAGGIGGTGSVSATASGNLTIDQSISVGGPVTLTASNGNLAINSAVATPASTITLSAGGSGSTVTQGVSGSLSATNLALLGGNVTLEHSANAISTIAASGVAALTYADSDALTIGTVGATTGINATGPVRIETLSGDLTVTQNIATTNTGTSALILNAGKATAAGTITGGNLLISGAPTVTIGSGGRATLYSGSIDGSTGVTSLVGSGSGRFRYNSDESTTNYTLALGSGLHGIYRENPTVSVAVENKTMTYGDPLPTWTYTTSGMVNGDQVAQAFASPGVSVGGTTSTSGSYTAGNHTLTASGLTSSQLGYAVGTLTNGTMTVNTKSTTVSGLTAADKVYDGTTSATVAHSGATFTGLVAGDTVTASGTTGTFATKQVGTGKTVTLSGTTYAGADAGNYTFTDQSSTTAAITPKAATVSGLTAADKVYDGTTTATVAHSGATFTGLVAGDTVTASGTTGTFATKQVGTGKTVTLSGTTYAGADAGNYTFTDQSSTTATITPKAATVSGLTAADKVYDGTTTATVAHSGATFTGLVAGDTVTASGTTGTFATKQVGTGKTVTLSGTTYAGADAGNYTFTDQANTTADITAKAATVSGLTASNKVYDGTTAATVNHGGVSFSGLVAGDTVTASGTTGSFNTKQVGSGKTVTLSGTTYGGADAGNYTFTDQANTTADITAKAATVSGLTASNKVYDGTTAATVNHGSASFSGLVAGDTVTASGTTGTFATKQVGTGKTVTLSGTTYGGADAGNYTFTDQGSTTATITAKALAIDLQGQGTRVYDGTTTILLNSVTPSLTGVVSGDTVNVATGNVTGFLDKNVGTNKAVTYSGFGLSGSDAGNYMLSTGSASSTASITPKAVTVSGLTAADKVYDGTTSATVAHSGASFSGLVAGDTVTASGTIGTFADALVGIAKPVTLSGTVYSGADAGNYVFTHQTVTSASILSLNTSPQFQQYLGGITQLSQTYKPVPGSASTLPPQSPPLVTGTPASTGGAGTAGLTTLFPIDGLIVNWIRETSVDGIRIVTVSIPQSIIARGDMISFGLPEDLITALASRPNHFAQTNGNPLPVWLEYDETEGQFRITEPATIPSLPYEVVADMDQSRVLVKIDTRVN